ncbi:hypothetical protein V8C42DRAFT_330875 [Trichoderma barbatum]
MFGVPHESQTIGSSLLIQNMTCRCASLSVWVCFALAFTAQYTLRLSGAYSFPGLPFAFFTLLAFLLTSSPFPVSPLLLLNLIQRCFQPGLSHRSRCQREPCGLRYTHVPSGPKWELESDSTVPHLRPCVGLSWGGKLPLTLHYLSLSLSLTLWMLTGGSPSPHVFLVFPLRPATVLTHRVPDYSVPVWYKDGPLVGFHYFRRHGWFRFASRAAFAGEST